jgi:hypothetical protein
MINQRYFLKYLDESKRIGGVLGFVSNEQYILQGLKNDTDFLRFMFDYLSDNLNHFYYYFLANFEKKIRNEIIENKFFQCSSLLIMLHQEIRDIYFLNVYGKEKDLWIKNSKSIDKTIERILKNYDPLYLLYLKEKGYGQLADLCFDIYLYYSFLGGIIGEYNTFIENYRKFLEYEWRETDFTNVITPENWQYGYYITAEQIHNINQNYS